MTCFSALKPPKNYDKLASSHSSEKCNSDSVSSTLLGAMVHYLSTIEAIKCPRQSDGGSPCNSAALKRHAGPISRNSLFISRRILTANMREQDTILNEDCPGHFQRDSKSSLASRNLHINDLLLGTSTALETVFDCIRKIRKRQTKLNYKFKSRRLI